MPQAPTTLLLELFTIFALAKLFGEVLERLTLPAVLGELLAGALLGPYLFGLVVPSETVFSIAELGAIFLLFTVGLETRPQDLLRVGQKSLLVATAGIVAPFVLGFAYMVLRGEPRHEATFVAAAMVATSVGITARVLADADALQSQIARIILGAAVFDDILGMILLALVSGLAASAGLQWVQLLVLTIEAVGFAVFMIVYAPRIVRRISPGLERMSTHQAPLVLALGICLGLSVAAEKIGLAAIIGAFFAGLAFAEYAPQWKLQPPVRGINEFLAPFFFFTMGTRLDVRLFTGGVLVAAIVITLLAFVSKIVACALPVLRDGRLKALTVGVGMTPRGEVALIVALVGLRMNIISSSAYAVVVFMTAFTTLLAPPVLRYLLRRLDAAALRQPAAELGSAEQPLRPRSV